MYKYRDIAATDNILLPYLSENKYIGLKGFDCQIQLKKDAEFKENLIVQFV